MDKLTSSQLHEAARKAYDEDDWPTFREANRILRDRGDYGKVESIPINGQCNAELEKF